MRSVLMVCLGNICRSPIAEVVLRSQAQQHSLQWSVTSAGTSAHYHEGAAADPGSVMIAKEHGLDLGQHRATQLVKKHLIKADIVYVMDRKNLIDVNILCGDDQHLKNKIKLLLSEIENCYSDEVPDPYGMNMHAFERVFYMIEDACTHIIKKHISQQ